MASRPALTLDDVRKLTDLSDPIETGTMQQERQQAIFSRADSLIVSTMHMEVVLPDAIHTFRLLSECSGPQCELLDPIADETDTVSVSTSQFVLGDAETIGSKHGITLMLESVHHKDVDVTALDAWMEYGSFALNTQRVIREEVESNTMYTLALGELTGRPLSGSGTWRHHGWNAHCRGR